MPGQTSVTGPTRRGFDSVAEYAIVVILVCEIGDARDQPQILREIVIPCKIKYVIGRNMRFRGLRVPNVLVLPELL
jgi:hypothetical protein